MKYKSRKPVKKTVKKPVVLNEEQFTVNQAMEIVDYLKNNGKDRYGRFLDAILEIGFHAIKNNNYRKSFDNAKEMYDFIYAEAVDIETFLLNNGKADYAQFVGILRELVLTHIDLDSTDKKED